ncbi:MAG: hypothetical protein JJ971_10390 [Balneolaceae bacterium]|nr:hypothetical protein [Balneolaceae bacterium]MBO6546347.1 hypothetical protein [Balneolaceae bacterium]MBO6648706.1 hypothetical protein [Balneolaceae bacterium]
MRYKLQKNPPIISVSVEASFTLLDFMALFACLLLGVFFALFLWIFAVAILIKVFTRNDYEFSSDTYSLTQYLRIFSYLRIKRRNISFDEIDRFLFSNFDSGQALVERGLINKEWFTLEIITKDKQRIELVKAQPDELEEMDRLYFELKDYLGEWFDFEVEYEELNNP